MARNIREENAKEDQSISRVVRAEIVFVGILFLLAMVSVIFICWIADKKALENQRNEQQRMAQKTKEEEIEEEQNRKPAKTPEQRLAERCWQLALERVHDKIGGKDPLDFAIWPNSINAKYTGFGDFNLNFDVGAMSIPDPAQRIKETAAKRKQLYGKYTQAKQALAEAFRKSTAKDEFETAEQHKARMRSKERERKQLEEKCDSILDEIVAFEKTCNNDLLRSTMNGLYTLDEALIYVPYTDWSYDAEKSLFNVNARFINDPEATRKALFYRVGYTDRSYDAGKSQFVNAKTFQAFHFPLKGIRASQFVRSNMVQCQYKIAHGGWAHPRKFKEYKQKHPFLLIRLGKCSMKVQGTAERIMTMPLHYRTKEEKEQRIKIVTSEVLDEEESFLGSSLRGEARSICRKIENESLHRSASIFDVKTSEKSYGRPSITEVFADYETAEGRAKIENVLKHFEDIGGVYYKEFCKAVRLQLANDAK